MSYLRPVSTGRFSAQTAQDRTAVDSRLTPQNIAWRQRIKTMMLKNGHRLAFLIVEEEPSEGLSTRKLLIESAKHNVITAYSVEEGMRTFKRFLNVDAVVIHGDLKDSDRLAKRAKELNPDIRVVCLSPQIAGRASWADETVNPHDPAELLQLLEKLGGRTDI